MHIVVCSLYEEFTKIRFKENHNIFNPFITYTVNI